MNLLLAFAVGACIGLWLDIAIQRWGDVLLDTYIGRGLAAIFDYLHVGLVDAWELVRFDLPRWVRSRESDR